MKKSHYNFTNNAGSVLFIVLIIIFMVLMTVIISSIKLNGEIDFIENESAKLNAYIMCHSGYEYAENRILTSAKNRIELIEYKKNHNFSRLLLNGDDIFISISEILQNKYKTNLGLSDKEIQEMNFILNLQDSAGLINFFKINKNLFKNYLIHNGVDQNRTRIIIDSIYDWVDPDDFSRPYGAEKSYYSSNSDYLPSNRLFDSIDELLLVKGIKKNIFNKIKNSINFSIQNSGLNPNTMPKTVFKIFRDLNEDIIKHILKRRIIKEIVSVAELNSISNYNFSKFPGVFQFFTSNTIYVQIRHRVNNGRLFFVKYKLLKKHFGTNVVKIKSNERGLMSNNGNYFGYLENLSILERVEGTESK